MSRIACFFNKHLTQVPVHPLLIATFCLAAGIGFQAWAHSSWFIAVILAFAGATGFSLYTKQTRYLLFFATFAFGALLYKKQLADHENFLLTLPKKPVTVIALVTNKEDIPNNPRIKQLLMVQLEKIYMPTPDAGNWEKTEAQVQIYLARPADVEPGDTIAITGINLKKPTNSDFGFYLVKEGVAASACMPKLSYVHLHHPQYSVCRALWDLKTDLLYRIKDKLSRTTFALFSSIFLGNKQIVKKEMNTIKDYYKTWGISHHLARSGLHLVIFIAIWGLFLNLTPIPFMLKQLLLLLVCTIYLLLSWTSISFMRAFFTFFIYKLCTLSKVSPNTLHALTIVTFCTLALNPAQLFFLDFQLSFGLTGALAWFNLVMHAQNSVLTHTNRPYAQKC